eukprot:TRINITY_DN10346_c1_g1_i1.p1 TRINITY_DN10346_c1_g1~~TRINITY_DN10346_c1_g1_i1.p1  ORF type:complete len:939 (+),score=197.90 TRINITY_DN10346_c1_g1_i1:221-3037(+)
MSAKRAASPPTSRSAPGKGKEKGKGKGKGKGDNGNYPFGPVKKSEFEAQFGGEIPFGFDDFVGAAPIDPNAPPPPPSPGASPRMSKGGKKGKGKATQQKAGGSAPTTPRPGGKAASGKSAATTPASPGAGSSRPASPTPSGKAGGKAGSGKAQSPAAQGRDLRGNPQGGESPTTPRTGGKAGKAGKAGGKAGKGDSRSSALDRTTSPPDSPGAVSDAEPVDEKDLEPSVLLLRHLVKKFGSAKKAFLTMDVNNNGTLSLMEMENSLDTMKVPWRKITGCSSMRHAFRGHALVKRKLGFAELFRNFDMGDDAESVDSEFWVEKIYDDPDEVRKFASWAGPENKWDDIGKIFSYPNKTTYKKDFIALCSLLKCPADVELIWKYISQECLTMKKKYVVDQGDGTHLNVCSLQQMRTFEFRAKRLMKQCSASVATQALVAALRGLRGTAIAGWRHDVDRNQAGRVSKAVFQAAVSDLPEMKTQGPKTWRALRPRQADQSPVCFAEVCPEEAALIDAFAEAVWKKHGFDMDRAWNDIDESRQNSLTFEEFESAARRVGYEGDVKTLFGGLANRTCNRLRKDDFAYVSKICGLAHDHLPRGAFMIHEFINWVQATFGCAEGFIAALGLTPERRVIGVADLKAHLVAMGFPGDALQIAARAARLEGGTFVSVLSLEHMLNKMQPANPPAARWTKGKSTSPDRRTAWDGHLIHGGLINKMMEHTLAVRRKSIIRRGSSSGVERLKKSRKSIIRKRWIPTEIPPEKPQWNEHIYPFPEAFQKSETPYKDGMLARAAEKERRLAEAAAEANRLHFLKFAEDERLDHLSMGEKVLVRIKIMLDESKRKYIDFLQKMDNDGSGDIDLDELEECLENMGFDLSDDDREDLFGLIDKDGSGAVTVKEMVQTMRKAAKKAGLDEEDDLGPVGSGSRRSSVASLARRASFASQA